MVGVSQCPRVCLWFCESALTANAALVSSCGSNATGGAHRRIRGRGGEIGGAKRDSSTIVCVRPLSTVVYLAAVMTAGLMLGDQQCPQR